MPHVFISYATEDRATAAQLAHWLEARQWEVWWDRDVIVGEQYDQVIETALDSAFAVIVLWSRVSVTSRWVRAEASSAAKRDVLVPIAIESANIPLEFRTLQTLDLFGWVGNHADGRLENIENALVHRFGSQGTSVSVVPHNSSPPVSALKTKPETEGGARDPTSERRRRLWYAAMVLTTGGALLLVFVVRPWDVDMSQQAVVSSRTPPETASTGLTLASDPPTVGSTSVTTSSVDGSTSEVVTTPGEPIAMQAEDQTLSGPMVEFTDPQAQGQAYVGTTTENFGALEFEFDIAQGGDYVVWARVSSPEPQLDHNSFFVSINSGQGDTWDFFEDTEPPGEGWHWELISLRCGGKFDQHNCNPWQLRLDTGHHTLKIVGREVDSRLDAIVITSDRGYIPENF